ncbi:MAG: hypothetical protein QM534_16850 [Sediminibacterium sp.]|nr:hypothetical protein [Sediminibacterium sp.]
MDIIIDKSKTLKEVQNEFQKRFPFLKIEFYETDHSPGEGSNKANTLNTALSIEEAQKKEVSGTIKINGLMKVADLERAFAETFCLPAQVFRRSGQLWLQTTTTDNWTLAEQNHKAMEKHEQMEADEIDPLDFKELE